jgi:hypothetical protein
VLRHSVRSAGLTVTVLRCKVSSKEETRNCSTYPSVIFERVACQIHANTGHKRGHLVTPEVGWFGARFIRRATLLRPVVVLKSQLSLTLGVHSLHPWC